MLRVTGLSKRYGEREVLRGVDLALGSGEVTAVVGESGSGKSTLLNLIAGLDLPDRGRIEIDGRVLVEADPAQRAAGLDEHDRSALRSRKIGFVFQAFHILPHLTVGQNVELPLVLLEVPPAERATRVQAMLAQVGLAARGGSPPSHLSGGELQRVAVARALVHRPALVLADEPTGNLDPDTARRVLQVLIDNIKSQGTAAILVTHSAQAARTADRVLRLDDGRLRVLDGEREDDQSVARETGIEDPPTVDDGHRAGAPTLRRGAP
jgi:putative ABC transport system ATP-binding protein